MSAVKTKGSTPTGGGGSSSAEETRERLVAAATTLFSEKGFDGTSVKQLADAAGVNVSLVSYHFGGKDGLFAACLERFGKERLALAQRVLQPPRSREELELRLRMFIEEMFSAHNESPDCASIIHRECDMDNPIVEGVFRNTFIKVFETLVAFVVSGQQVGVVRTDIDPMIAASCMFGSLVHFMKTDRIGEKLFNRTIKEEGHRKTVVDHWVRLTIDGLTHHAVPTPQPPGSIL